VAIFLELFDRDTQRIQSLWWRCKTGQFNKMETNNDSLGRSSIFINDMNINLYSLSILYFIFIYSFCISYWNKNCHGIRSGSYLCTFVTGFDKFYWYICNISKLFEMAMKAYVCYHRLTDGKCRSGEQRSVKH